MRLSFPERFFTDTAEAALTDENGAASRSTVLAAVRQRIRRQFFIAHHRTTVNGELVAARKKDVPRLNGKQRMDDPLNWPELFL
jgi:hypothetical protein